MKTKLLKGTVVADKINCELIQKIENLKIKGIIPGLAAILIGKDPASKVYINSKEKAFKKLNCHTETFSYPADTKETTIINLIKDLNENNKFHGILIQLPLPKIYLLVQYLSLQQYH